MEAYSSRYDSELRTHVNGSHDDPASVAAPASDGREDFFDGTRQPQCVNGGSTALAFASSPRVSGNPTWSLRRTPVSVLHTDHVYGRPEKKTEPVGLTETGGGQAALAEPKRLRTSRNGPYADPMAGPVPLFLALLSGVFGAAMILCHNK